MNLYATLLIISDKYLPDVMLLGYKLKYINIDTDLIYMIK